jgi:hypothetical protein
MLASTVQFSNNNQPPITPPCDECTGAGIHEDANLTAAPSDTQQRARHHQTQALRSTPKQY